VVPLTEIRNGDAVVLLVRGTGTAATVERILAGRLPDGLDGTNPFGRGGSGGHGGASRGNGTVTDPGTEI
jgi:hypothetical protein